MSLSSCRRVQNIVVLKVVENPFDMFMIVKLLAFGGQKAELLMLSHHFELSRFLNVNFLKKWTNQLGNTKDMGKTQNKKYQK